MSRSRLLRVALGLGLALFAAAPAFAEPKSDDPEDGTALQWTNPVQRSTGLQIARGNGGASFGYGYSSANELKTDGITFGLSGAYYFNRFVGVEAAATRQKWEFLPDEVLFDTPPLSAGQVKSWVLSVSGLVRYPVGRQAAVYATGGLAYFINDYAVDSSTANELSALGFQVLDRMDNALGFNVAGGVNILAFRSFGFYTEVRYLWAEADTIAEISEPVTGTSSSFTSTQSLKILAWTGGVRLYF